MPARILDGAAVARQIRDELAARAAAFERTRGRRAALAIILVGEKPDSQLYVNSKLKSAADEGMNATLSHLPASATIDEVLDLLIKLNSEGITIIMIEHIMHAVVRFSERVMCLDAGRIIASGTPAEVMAEKRVQEAYLGAHAHG